MLTIMVFFLNLKTQEGWCWWSYICMYMILFGREHCCWRWELFTLSCTEHRDNAPRPHRRLCWLLKMKNHNTSDEKLSRLSQAKEKDLMTTLVRPPCSARFATRSKLWLFLDKCLVRIILVWYPQIAKLWKNLARNKYKQNWIIFNPIWTLADAPTCLWVRK